MRIIRGKYGHRRFTVPPTFKARPTTDMAKENIFNVLENLIDWEETRALDLFAGTGSIGLEMVSRGCPYVVGVELDPQHADFIKKVVALLHEEDYHLVRGDALKYIATASSSDSFDLIFADPPYALPELQSLPDRILSGSLLATDGLLVLEHPRDYSFQDHPNFDQERKYGSVHFSLFRHHSE